MRVGAARVLVDYAHNPAAITGLIDFVLELPATRRIGAITAPGDRRDDDLREVGRLCARLDHAIVKEDVDTRGRDRGEIARLIMDGLAEGGMSRDRMEAITDEREAVERTLRMLQPGELAIILADDVPGVIQQIRPHASPSAT